MLFRVDVTGKSAAEVQHVTLSALRLKERYDLQEWILQNPRILGEDFMVITSEFSGFDKTAERLDVLALSKRGVLTVIELKRSAVGTAAELQALRYAAYCSTMSLRDISELLSGFESRKGIDIDPAEAERRIKEFVDEPDYAQLGNKPRIVLGAEEFSAEITSTVLWLRDFGVDISCVRLRPYQVDGQLLLESSVLIPLPEAREFQIRREIKDADQTRQVQREITTPQEFLAGVPIEVRPAFDELRTFLLAQEDVEEETFKTLLSYRRRADRKWITWLQFTRWEARAGVAPEIEVDPSLLVRKTPSGWQIIRARTVEDAQQVKLLIMASRASQEAR